jgi:hypothetical protein
MIINVMVTILHMAFSTAVAESRTCEGIGMGQAYQTILMNETAVCFIYAESSEAEKGALSTPAYGMYIYYVSRVGRLTFAQELPYAGTKGRIHDVFLSHAAGAEALFIIYSIEKPRSWDSISDIYGVSVLGFHGDTLIQDKKLSRFFGMSGDFSELQSGEYYSYPYKKRASIEEALRSPEFLLTASIIPVKGVVKAKAFLYGGDLEPTVKTRMYLIGGDQVMVQDSTEGLCKISYAAKKKTITKWILCSMIDFS